MNKHSSSCRSRWLRIGAAILCAASTTPAAASVVMNGTRFVYRAGEKEIVVKVSNVGKLPALTQAWLDDGNANAKPETIDVPFNVTPPISRVEAGKAQTLRVAYTGGELPTDRESQFWLNILEVPPKAEATEDDVGQMQLAFRYRLKLFYRPKGLAGSADAAAERLAWSIPGGGGVSVGNDSAFHVTVNDVKLKVDGKDVEAEPFALEPHGVYTVPTTTVVEPGSKVDVEFQTINDYGGFVAHKATLGQ
ncbi:MAG TPA: fimbria/pilus periplasmic chaperone [Luteibacter sp.]|uniref:fimbrial biogenesis chaperone n=1 Tax=Luteibacter sp. TaxID=1886636 RepID=UPI002BA77758|nr:fimbria/pilus periplasmic chaperone [Luteibacter sp.]HVI56690.1 fimbria/pilus periplasmic chaperone [Luteibacter sp.]